MERNLQFDRSRQEFSLDESETLRWAASSRLSLNLGIKYTGSLFEHCSSMIEASFDLDLVVREPI